MSLYTEAVYTHARLKTAFLKHFVRKKKKGAKTICTQGNKQNSWTGGNLLQIKYKRQREKRQ